MRTFHLVIAVWVLSLILISTKFYLVGQDWYRAGVSNELAASNDIAPRSERSLASQTHRDVASHDYADMITVPVQYHRPSPIYDHLPDRAGQKRNDGVENTDNLQRTLLSFLDHPLVHLLR
jgi:hypothetical protein